MVNTQQSPAAFNTTNTIGVDITNNVSHLSTPASSAVQTALFYPETQNPDFAPGQIVMTGGGGQYIFAQVGTIGSINTSDFVAFLQSVQSVFVVNQITSAIGATGPRVGVFQGSAIAGGTGPAGLPASSSTLVQWCWIALSGSNLVGNTPSTTTQGANLFVTGTAGQLSSVSTSAVMVMGVTTAVSAVNSVGGNPIICNQMMVAVPTSTASPAFAGPF